jgi:hypothetical protein
VCVRRPVAKDASQEAVPTLDRNASSIHPSSKREDEHDEQEVSHVCENVSTTRLRLSSSVVAAFVITITDAATTGCGYAVASFATMGGEMERGPGGGAQIEPERRPLPPERAGKSREEIRDEIRATAWYQDLTTPKLGPGAPAADFSLPVLDANHGLTNATVRLSDYGGKKPVALMFGSYT